MNPKIIAMYLPQFHCIPENDEFWGNGFTDWVTVKNARPLFKGHIQPKVPLNNNYYDLSKKENVIWQSKLASKYGIYGWGVYHYWFNNEKNLLTAPAEIIRDNAEVDINYFLAWDNANWKRSWSNISGNAWAPIVDRTKTNMEQSPIMIPYILGDKPDWENHYNSVKNHFESSKYIKVNGKPVFMIFNSSDRIIEMCDFWNELAKKDGFSGIHFIFKKKDGIQIPIRYKQFKYEPLYSGWPRISFHQKMINKLRIFFRLGAKVKKYNYDHIWTQIIRNAERDTNPNIYHGAFVSYDDTPRRGNEGRLVVGSSPMKFEKYIKKLKDISEEQKKDFIFVTAWNEWGEGAYFEPDQENDYDYLKSLSHNVY